MRRKDVGRKSKESPKRRREKGRNRNSQKRDRRPIACFVKKSQAVAIRGGFRGFGRSEIRLRDGCPWLFHLAILALKSSDFSASYISYRIWNRRRSDYLRFEGARPFEHKSVFFALSVTRSSLFFSFLYFSILFSSLFLLLFLFFFLLLFL